MCNLDSSLIFEHGSIYKFIHIMFGRKKLNMAELRKGNKEIKETK